MFALAGCWAMMDRHVSDLASILADHNIQAFLPSKVCVIIDDTSCSGLTVHAGLHSSPRLVVQAAARSPNNTPSIDSRCVL
jgi:hypothetical protein